MTDREQLELAAKAAGIEVTHWHADGYPVALIPGRGLWGWDPATDDGDALRLLARLRLQLDYRPGFVGVCKSFGPYIGQCPHDEEMPHDAAATRKAILRAAAEIGKAMP